MIQIDLNEQERKILDETLTSYLSDLSYEIADTDNMDLIEAFIRVQNLEFQAARLSAFLVELANEND